VIATDTPAGRARALLARFVAEARRQQSALARFQREEFEAATRLLDALVPALREAGPDLDPRAVQEALHIVSATLAVLEALGQARDRIGPALRALGASAGLSIDLEV
jgi:hypothetical protein